MKINYDAARRTLEEEVHQINTIAVGGEWVDLVQRLSDECRDKNKTMIAMLGTAILAKATEINVDVFSLQVGDEDGASNTYSARALCKEVLAAEANRLGIDLGVTGREPLNNQPFFGKARVSSELKVRTDARGALQILMEGLALLDEVKTEKQARAVLRAFLQVRRRKVSVLPAPVAVDDSMGLGDLVSKVVEFVGDNSEGGKRAQAVAVGLLSLVYGNDQLLAKKVNDPSRSMPGDIGIRDSNALASFKKVFEVKDKPITTRDLELLIDGAMKFKIPNVCMLAVSKDQADIDIDASVRWAEGRQISLRVLVGWEQFIVEALFWADHTGPTISDAVRCVAASLLYYDVSEEGYKSWIS